MPLLAASNTPLAARLHEQLALVEARFAAELLSDLPTVNSLVDHVERYRGKMLRPMLVLTSGLASVEGQLPLTDAHRTVAAVVEMVHMATLVHDDVLDEADVRRGGDTVNRLRGNEAAVMLGDYLISHAYHLCCSLDQPDVARLVAATTNTVCEGELLQLANRNNWQLDEPTYEQIILRKTASLTGLCCRLGAVLHGLDDARAAALEAYGRKVGMAFQIVDDLLDLTGQEQVVGKSLRLDLRKGKLTLPLIRGLAAADSRQRPVLVQLLTAAAEADEATAPRAVAPVRAMLEQLGALTAARQRAADLLAQAKRGLGGLPGLEARHLLEQMADAVLSRRY